MTFRWYGEQMSEYSRLQVYAMKSHAAASRLKVRSEFGRLFFPIWDSSYVMFGFKKKYT